MDVKLFLKYTADIASSFTPEMLDLGRGIKGYCIFNGPAPLLTPGGKPYSHESERLLKLVLAELQLTQTLALRPISSPLLFAYGKDFLEQGKDYFTEQWDDLLLSDHFVRVKSFGGKVSQVQGPEDKLMSFRFHILGVLMSAVNDYTGRMLGDLQVEEGENHPFLKVLSLSYSKLPVESKSAVQALSTLHNSGLVLPLLLVLGEIDTMSYCNGLISLNIRPVELLTEIQADTVLVMSYLSAFQQKKGSGIRLTDLISQGEGDSLEFKSTLRWDIRAGKTNPAIERSCLKTMAAFLNSRGGILLIGVRDDGSVEGIETDKFLNEDKFLLHLWTMIRTCLGMNVSRHIHAELMKEGEKTVCVVECEASDGPVFLRQPGFDEEMFLRCGPSSNALSISEALKYIEDHFSPGVK